MNRIRKYYRLPRPERKLFWEALRKLYWCKLILSFISFKKCTQYFRMKGKAEPKSREELMSVKVAIHRANTVAFWKNKCLVSTLCARWMLNKRGLNSKAFLGLKKEESGKMKAHAWLVSGDIYIVHDDQTFNPVYSF